MDNREINPCLQEVLNAYEWDGHVKDFRKYGLGHINDTYAVVTKSMNGKESHYILQKINKNIFKNPEQVMENILGVTNFLKKKIVENDGDPDRETLTVYKTKTHLPYYLDSQGEYWRVFPFIEDTICLQQVENEEQFFESARSFGKFMKMLGDYKAETLYETIPHFHDTPKRYENFLKAVEKDRVGRAPSVEKEIAFIKARKEDCSYLTDKLQKGELPLRVTHNDTKLNNILLDVVTQEGVCIIDLDTIMPGLAAYDFGDSIRFGAATAAEDEKDLEKVHFSKKLYDVYLEGYLQEAGAVLTEKEVESLPWGAKLMTLECGIRFLTDYLEGDTYFKVAYSEQNLDRARTQLKLVEEMEGKLLVGLG